MLSKFCMQVLGGSVITFQPPCSIKSRVSSHLCRHIYRCALLVLGLFNDSFSAAKLAISSGRIVGECCSLCSSNNLSWLILTYLVIFLDRVEYMGNSEFE